VHLTRSELEAGVAAVREAPKDVGCLALIVCRPTAGEREILASGVLDVDAGLAGDNWLVRGSKATIDGRAHPDRQLTVMNARAARLIAGPEERWALAGDQLYVDLDLSADNLPAGSRLAIDGAIIEITGQPHLGCAKFVARFGLEAMRFVNSEVGRALNLRGVNARIIHGGTIKNGDTVRRRPATGVL
jgi:MOSC domain-containing protein YiiM